VGYCQDLCGVEVYEDMRGGGRKGGRDGGREGKEKHKFYTDVREGREGRREGGRGGIGQIKRNKYK